MLYVFSSKFRVENDARNENFNKKLLSEILAYFVFANSNVPLIKKPNSTRVKSHAINVGFGLKNSSNFVLIVIVVFTNKFTKVQQINYNVKHKEHSLIAKPIKPFSVCAI